MNEQLQIRVGLFSVTVGKRPALLLPMAGANEWRTEAQQQCARYPLADDGQYIHSRMPPPFVFERAWRDYTRHRVFKTELVRRQSQSFPNHRRFREKP